MYLNFLAGIRVKGFEYHVPRFKFMVLPCSRSIYTENFEFLALRNRAKRLVSRSSQTQGDSYLVMESIFRGNIQHHTREVSQSQLANGFVISQVELQPTIWYT